MTATITYLNTGPDSEIALDTRPLVTSPQEAVDILGKWAHEDKEHTVALFLNTKHRLIKSEVIAIGTVANTFMVPREVFRAALLAGAASLVIGHNHPSGDPEPSDDDLAVTQRISEAARIIGVNLLDHIVVGSNGWVSLARRGAI